MPADENKEPKPIPLWLDKVKGTLPRREDELAKAIQKNIGRKNTTEGKPTKNASSSKNTCICAPTKHEGSFRCHLHRTNLVAQNTDKSNLNAKNGHHDVVEKHARLSRFRRAASARTCHGNLGCLCKNLPWKPFFCWSISMAAGSSIQGCCNMKKKKLENV